MKRIIEIVPARPGWYARWRQSPEATRSYPVTVWALVEDTDVPTREVVGVDSIGQWPGADDNEAGSDFVRYVYQAPEAGQPDDASNPVGADVEPPSPVRA
ncbi:hypothetical protein [Polymorphospora rubra]|nr:hypothetical protein [Polymorphospora rubra]